MQKEIQINNQTISYTLTPSLRAKYVRLTIKPGGAVVLTVPRKSTVEQAEKFLEKHSAWILKKLVRMETKQVITPARILPNEVRLHKRLAAEMLKQKIPHFNQFYGFKFSKVSVRSKKTSWGSCSRKGTLSFNWKIALLPEEVADYIVVHELCHLKEFNHSENFWNLVGRTIPNYKVLRQQLKNIL